MNTAEEQLLSYILGIEAMLDELKITDPKRRASLTMVAARKMGQAQGEMLIARFDRESLEAIHKAINEKGGDKDGS